MTQGTSMKIVFLGSIAAIIVLFLAIGLEGNDGVAWAIKPAIESKILAQQSQKNQADELLQLGIEQANRNQLREALQSWKQALELYRQISDRQGEARLLGNLGHVYLSFDEYEDAIYLYYQSLHIWREIRDSQAEAKVLNHLGLAYRGLGEYEGAIRSYQKSLKISRESRDRQSEIMTLGDLRASYDDLDQYERTTNLRQQPLTANRKLIDLFGEGVSSGDLSPVYNNLEEYKQALELHQKSLVIANEIRDRPLQARALRHLGSIHLRLGEYEQAINLHQQSLEIARETRDRQLEARLLGHLGNVYLSLGEYERVINLHQQSLKIARETHDRKLEARALIGFGNAYFYTCQAQNDSSQCKLAFDLYQQSLTIAQEIHDRQGQAAAWNNLANSSLHLGQNKPAIDFLQQSLEIAREINDRQIEADSLHSLGLAYANQKDHTTALSHFQQALMLFKTIGAREGEGLTLSDLGRTFNDLNRPQLAIIFYKASVNVREAIRGDIQGLSLEEQQSYTNTIADSYRALADLLLQQNRIPEAQRVLDLLKLQELDDYFQGIQRSADSQTGVGSSKAEQDILNLYINHILAAEELASLTKRPPKDLSNPERQRLEVLQAEQGQISRDFSQFLEREDVTTALKALNAHSEAREALEPRHFKRLKDDLAKLPQRSALLYPLILRDRLELVLVLPNLDPVHVSVSVSAEELNQLIVAFSQDLSRPNSNPLPPAQQLYRLLIKPLEPALSGAQVTHLFYAPDGALRYIPLAALHDGNGPNNGQWLTERFTLSNITAASLTDFASNPDRNLRLFAGACAQCSFSFEINGRPYHFRDLPATQTEVETLAQAFREKTVLLNREFSPAQLKLNLGYYNLLHLATHGAFVEGDPRESFIVFGDGSRASLREIRETWDLSRQELVVLSACQTAVGGSQLGNGVEILGLGYQMQASGAKATLSSLWLVSDTGTQRLMNQFYAALLQGDRPLTKPQALQQAQRALITGKFEAGHDEERASVVGVGDRSSQSKENNLSHPYYWAPFILIGNGL